MEVKDLVEGGPIILFDGTCGLCDGWVRFVLRHDRQGRFRFAPLQSPTGARLLEAHGLSRTDLSSIVLVTAHGAERRSTAVLYILRGLGGIWSLAYVSILVPAWLRDRLYGFIARHRHEWFAPPAACRVPTIAEQERFV